MTPTLDEELALENDEAWHIAFEGCFDKDPVKARAQCNAFREMQRSKYNSWSQEDQQRRFVEVINYLREHKEYPPTDLPEFSDDHRTIDEILTPTGTKTIRMQNQLTVTCVQYDQLLVAESVNDDFVEGYKDLAKRDEHAVRNRLLALRQGGPNGDHTTQFVPSTTRTCTFSNDRKKTVTVQLIPRTMHVLANARVPCSVAVDHEVEHVLGRLYDGPARAARHGTPDSQFDNHEERQAVKRETISLVLMNKPVRNSHYGVSISSRGVTSCGAGLKVAIGEEPFQTVAEHKSTGYIYELREKQNELVMSSDAGPVKYYLSEVARLIALEEVANNAAWGDAKIASFANNEARALIEDAYLNGNLLTITAELDGRKLPTIENFQHKLREQGITDTTIPADDVLREAYEGMLQDGFIRLSDDVRKGGTASECFKYASYESFKKGMVEASQYGDAYVNHFKEQYLIEQQLRLRAQVFHRKSDWVDNYIENLGQMRTPEASGYEQMDLLLQQLENYQEELISMKDLAADVEPVLQVEAMNTKLLDQLEKIANYLDTSSLKETAIASAIEPLVNENASRQLLLAELANAQEDTTEAINFDDSDNEATKVWNAVSKIQAVLVLDQPLSGELLEAISEPMQALNDYDGEEEFEAQEDCLHAWLSRENYRVQQQALQVPVTQGNAFKKASKPASEENLIDMLDNLRSLVAIATVEQQATGICVEEHFDPTLLQGMLSRTSLAALKGFVHKVLKEAKISSGSGNAGQLEPHELRNLEAVVGVGNVNPSVKDTPALFDITTDMVVLGRRKGENGACLLSVPGTARQLKVRLLTAAQAQGHEDQLIVFEKVSENFKVTVNLDGQTVVAGRSGRQR